MITARTTRLLRAADLQSLHVSIARLVSGADALSARQMAVLVPTHGAAAALRRTLENRLLAEGQGAIVLPDIVTRTDFYQALHRAVPDAPALLSEFEREVLFRRAARVASDAGAPAPFRLRAGLILEILRFYDDLRRRNRTVDDFDRLLIDSLEPVADIDRGAERMLRQTRFLTAAFREFERRVGLTGRIDEHALRQRLIDADDRLPYTHVVVTVPDQAADARGLWPADYDLLTRMPGVERIDVIATEALLGTGFHQRVHDLFPGLEEEKLPAGGDVPVLAAPEASLDRDDRRWFVSRDREEELSDVARAFKSHPSLDRVAVVFQRPLPYLYLARQVFPDARIPYQALDALPLAAEPLAAALDLVFDVAIGEATRLSLVDLLGSPQWRFEVAGETPTASQIAGFDALLRDLKYLGGWERLQGLVAQADEAVTGPNARAWTRAAVATRAAGVAASAIKDAIEAPTASQQVRRLATFIQQHERLPDAGDSSLARHLRARAAILSALASLAAAHAAHDDEPLMVTELVNTIRRWIEGQTFSPRTGDTGLNLLDAPAACYADVDDVRIVGLVESDWPERSRRSIFYPASLLAQLGWSAEIDRLTAARARFHDLLHLARRRVSVSTFTLEDDAIVGPSPFVEEIEAAGLPVERVLPAAPPRVFAQEGLREAPLAPDAVTGSTAEWLAMRVGRTASGDPAYHGEAGARPPAQYAVSHVERYLECPFKYYANYVLRLEEERDEEAGLTPRERGEFLHLVFQEFFTEWVRGGQGTITADNLPEAVRLFETTVERNLRDLPEAERALERNYLLGSAAAQGLAERAFAFEIEQGAGVIERLLEYAIEGEFEFAGETGPARIRIRGKADRVDVLDDGSLRVVDYKLGRAPKPGRSLQLPIYGIAASQALERRDRKPHPLGRAGYVAFKEKNAFVALANPNQMAQALADGQKRFVGAVEAIERGTFPVNPDEPFLCTRCGYASVCRKDYVGDE